VAENPARQEAEIEFTIQDGKPFGMAGLWEPWKNPKTNQLEDTFAILTVEANETMTPIHDRQPSSLRHAITKNIWRIQNGRHPFTSGPRPGEIAKSLAQCIG
jgi:putative SOS response-associated peptidase YedK